MLFRAVAAAGDWGVGAYLSARRWQGRRAAWRKPDAMGHLQAESVWLDSTAGKIACSLVRVSGSRAAFVLAHGIGENRFHMASRADWLRRLGYSSLLLDFRAHGDSDGRVCTFGLEERHDVDAAVRFLREELPTQPLGLIGFSLGAAAGLLSESLPQFRALVIEAPYSTLADAVAVRCRRWFGPFAHLVARAFLDRQGEVSGVSLARAARAAGAPLLILSGESDPYVTPDQLNSLCLAAPHASAHRFPGVRHENFHWRAPDGYERVVSRFLAGSLGEQP